MIEINYQVNNSKGSIYWAAAEEFEELYDNTFELGKMEAKDIQKLQGISELGKLLLSAVAGAVIQHLLDDGISPEEIFNSGKFWLK